MSLYEGRNFLETEAVLCRYLLAVCNLNHESGITDMLMLGLCTVLLVFLKELVRLFLTTHNQKKEKKTDTEEIA